MPSESKATPQPKPPNNKNNPGNPVRSSSPNHNSNNTVDSFDVGMARLSSAMDRLNQTSAALEDEIMSERLAPLDTFPSLMSLVNYDNNNNEDSFIDEDPVKDASEDADDDEDVNFKGTFGDMLDSAAKLFDKYREHLSENDEDEDEDKTDKAVNGWLADKFKDAMWDLFKGAGMTPEKDLTPEEKAQSEVFDASFERVQDPLSLHVGFKQVKKFDVFLKKVTTKVMQPQ